MIQQQLDFGGIVFERRPDLVPLELVMFVTAHGGGGAQRRERAAQLAGLGPKVERMPARRQLHVAFFDDRNAVLCIVVPIARAGVPARRRPGRAEIGKGASRLRVLDRAFGSFYIAGMPAPPPPRTAD